MTIMNNTQTPIGVKVFTTGRGFIVKSGILNTRAREVFTGLER